MFFANIANARRRAITHEENVFDEIDRQHRTITPQKVTPSLTRELRVNIGKTLKEKRKYAEKAYGQSFARGSRREEESAHRKFQEAKDTERRYNEFKRERLESRLKPVKAVFNVLKSVGTTIKKRKARRGIFKGFGQQSKGFAGMDYSQSPFRK